MNSKPPFSNNKTQVTTYEFLSDNDEPFVTIEYDRIPQDPLVLVSVDQSLEVPNLVSRTSRKGNVKIYHPFSKRMEEPPESSPSSCDSFYQCSPPKLGCGEKPVEVHIPNEGEVVTDDSSVHSSMRILKLERTITLNQLREIEHRKKSKKRTSKNSDKHAESSSIDPKLRRQTGQSVGVGTQTEPIDGRIEENLNQNTPSESFLVDAIQLSSDDDSEICVADDTPNILMRELAQQVLQKMEERKRATNELRRKRTAETDLAKQLVREIMHPGSQQVQSCAPQSVKHAREVPSSTVNRVDNCEDQRFELMTPKRRREAAWAESALARQLIQHLSRGYSLEQTIQELKSSLPSSNSRAGDRTSRGNSASVCGEPADEVTQGQHMEAQSAPAKQASRRKSSGDSLNHCIQTPAMQPECSSSAVTTVQTTLPSFSLAFNQSNGESRNSIRLPALQPESSGVAAIHPSHLLPPSCLIVYNVEDFVVPEDSSCIETPGYTCS